MISMKSSHTNWYQYVVLFVILHSGVTGKVIGGARKLQQESGFDSTTICLAANGTFTAKVDLFAGELGYYTFKECGDQVNPIIGLEIGRTYTFLQFHRSNYYHPLGFSYFPDGNLVGSPELAPNISASGSSCVFNQTCPAPMYFKGKRYLGVYSNINHVAPLTKNETYYGLADYEQLFTVPAIDWANMNPFSIKIRFDDENYGSDLFYFCHKHKGMSGRIKLLKNGQPINLADVPSLGYEYDAPGEFDKECGTFGLDDYQVSNTSSKCPHTFVCGLENTTTEMRNFSSCLNAADCKMMNGITTGMSADSPIALFIHQMIPHHRNSVNMAKALMKSREKNTSLCSDLSKRRDPTCFMEALLMETINSQNQQVQLMLKVLDMLGIPQVDKSCTVTYTSSAILAQPKNSSTTNDTVSVQSTSDQE